MSDRKCAISTASYHHYIDTKHKTPHYVLYTARPSVYKNASSSVDAPYLCLNGDDGHTFQRKHANTQLHDPPSMGTRRFGRTKKQAGGLIGRVECWSLGAGHCMAQCSFGLPKHSFGEHEMKSSLLINERITWQRFTKHRRRTEFGPLLLFCYIGPDRLGDGHDSHSDLTCGAPMGSIWVCGL